MILKINTIRAGRHFSTEHLSPYAFHEFLLEGGSQGHHGGEKRSLGPGDRLQGNQGHLVEGGECRRALRR